METLNEFLQKVPENTTENTEQTNPFVKSFKQLISTYVHPLIERSNKVLIEKNLPTFSEWKEKTTDKSLPTVEENFILISGNKEVTESDFFRYPYLSFLAYKQTGDIKISAGNTGLSPMQTRIDAFDAKNFEAYFTKFLDRSLSK